MLNVTGLVFDYFKGRSVGISNYFGHIQNFFKFEGNLKMVAQR